MFEMNTYMHAQSSRHSKLGSFHQSGPRDQLWNPPVVQGNQLGAAAADAPSDVDGRFVLLGEVVPTGRISFFHSTIYLVVDLLCASIALHCISEAPPKADRTRIPVIPAIVAEATTPTTPHSRALTWQNTSLCAHVCTCEGV